MDLKGNRVSTLPVLGMVIKVMVVSLLTRNAGAHLWFHSGLEEERKLSWKLRDGCHVRHPGLVQRAQVEARLLL